MGSKLNIIEPIIWIIVMILLWELFCWMKWVPKYVVASPSAIFYQGWELLAHGALLPHLYATLYVVILGFFLASVVAIGLAILIAHSEHLRTGVYSIIVVSRAIPQSALCPFYVLLFGFGPFPKIIVAFGIAFFPILVNTITGLTLIEAELLNLMHSLRATKWQVLTKIRLPSSLPYIFSSLKISGPESVIGTIIAEFIIGTKGLGYLIQVAVHQVDVPFLFVAIICMATIGLVLFEAVVIAEKLLPLWYKR